MAGEDSKKSGEIGETISVALLEKIGWKHLIKNISIDCSAPSHLNKEGKPKTTHGEDQVFLYNTPFHDERTEVIHVSNKNTVKQYPSSEDGLKRKFKEHLKQLRETIECAKYSPKLHAVTSEFEAKPSVSHSGLLIWLQNDEADIERNIKESLANSRLDDESEEPIYLIDNARAAFLLKAITDLESKGQYEFHYPRVGSALSLDVKRSGKFLPVEFIASEIIPAIIEGRGERELIIYANEPFSPDAYRRLIAYGLKFANGLLTKIKIGMPDYNVAHDQAAADQARGAFHERPETVRPFTFNRSILSFAEQD